MEGTLTLPAHKAPPSGELAHQRLRGSYSTIMPPHVRPPPKPMQASGLPAIADDSGLCVDALNGAPGIYSARYGGVDSDQARYRLLLENLRGAGARTAHFHTAIVCCFPNGDRLDAAGDCFGTIAYAPQGDNGFGYDPVFFVPELRKTFAQLTPEEKNAISHRGNALRAFAAELKTYLEKN